MTENASLHDSDGSEKIIATTKVIIPKDDGPIEATSTIETVPNSALFDHFENIGKAKQKSNFNINLGQLNDNDDGGEDGSGNKTSEKSESSMATQCTLTTIRENDVPVPSAPTLNDMLNDLKPQLYNFQMRQHEFANRTVLRSESCTYCLKK